MDDKADVHATRWDRQCYATWKTISTLPSLFDRRTTLVSLSIEILIIVSGEIDDPQHDSRSSIPQAIGLRIKQTIRDAIVDGGRVRRDESRQLRVN